MKSLITEPLFSETAYWWIFAGLAVIITWLYLNSERYGRNWLPKIKKENESRWSVFQEHDRNIAKNISYLSLSFLCSLAWGVISSLDHKSYAMGAVAAIEAASCVVSIIRATKISDRLLLTAYFLKNCSAANVDQAVGLADKYAKTEGETHGGTLSIISLNLSESETETLTRIIVFKEALEKTLSGNRKMNG